MADQNFECCYPPDDAEIPRDGFIVHGWHDYTNTVINSIAIMDGEDEIAVATELTEGNSVGGIRYWYANFDLAASLLSASADYSIVFDMDESVDPLPDAISVHTAATVDAAPAARPLGYAPPAISYPSEGATIPSTHFVSWGRTDDGLQEAKMIVAGTEKDATEFILLSGTRWIARWIDLGAANEGKRAVTRINIANANPLVRNLCIVNCPATVNLPAPTSYWKMEDHTNQIAGVPNILYSIFPVAGKQGWGLAYNGNYFGASQGAAGAPWGATNTDFSLAIWFKTNMSVSGSQYIVYLSRDNTNGGNWGVRHDSNGLRFYVRDGDKQHLYYTPNMGAYALDTWNFCCCRYKHSEKKLYARINNGTDVTQTIPAGIYLPSSNYLYVKLYGGYSIGPNVAYEEIGIWGSTWLTNADVEMLYNGGAGRTYLSVDGGHWE